VTRAASRDVERKIRQGECTALTMPALTRRPKSSKFRLGRFLGLVLLDEGPHLGHPGRLARM